MIKLNKNLTSLVFGLGLLFWDTGTGGSVEDVGEFCCCFCKLLVNTFTDGEFNDVVDSVSLDAWLLINGEFEMLRSWLDEIVTAWVSIDNTLFISVSIKFLLKSSHSVGFLSIKTKALKYF